MTMLLFCVLIAAFLDTDRIMHSSFFTVANLAPILDLNLLDDSLFASKGEYQVLVCLFFVSLKALWE